MSALLATRAANGQGLLSAGRFQTLREKWDFSKFVLTHFPQNLNFPPRSNECSSENTAASISIELLTAFMIDRPTNRLQKQTSHH